MHSQLNEEIVQMQSLNLIKTSRKENDTNTSRLERSH